MLRSGSQLVRDRFVGDEPATRDLTPKSAGYRDKAILAHRGWRPHIEEAQRSMPWSASESG
jgi:hypothetical protein